MSGLIKTKTAKGIVRGQCIATNAFIKKKERSQISKLHFQLKKLGKEGRSQDGGGIGRGDHFLFYKFIERTTER